MVIVVSTLAARFLKDKCGKNFLETLPKLTLGLGKGAAIALWVYFVIKVIALAHDSNWHLLNTGYGYWYLVEVLLLVLTPALIYGIGIKKRLVGVVRFAAFLTVFGVVMNRLNIAIITFNWNLPHHFQHIIPPWRDEGDVLPIATLHILVFRWILNRMPVLREEPAYEDSH